MPLHLLGKKSWNVYNSVNIERVKADEAKAEAQEQEQEQRLQAEDAANRIRILRGEVTDVSVHRDDKRQEDLADTSRRKRRRLRGEDDTDRDIRYAQEDLELGREAKARLNKTNDATLIGQDGHIQLFSMPSKQDDDKVEKNPQAEAEKTRKRQAEEDQYTMRFSNAAGFKNNMQAPWYAGNDSENNTARRALTQMPEKDVWGNEDPGRRDRERNRVTTNDPLAFMQQAQRQLKQSERDRSQWKTERDAEIIDLDRDEKRRSRHRHRRHHDANVADSAKRPARRRHGHHDSGQRRSKHQD